MQTQTTKYGNHEVILRNYDYIDIASKYGFFQNGYDKK